MELNTGKILRINLTNGKIGTETVPEKIAADFIGGGVMVSGIFMMR